MFNLQAISQKSTFCRHSIFQISQIISISIWNSYCLFLYFRSKILNIMALIFDIKRYAIHDGPGIRTTIFLKGCPLRCVWCHNPESWLPSPQRLYKHNKCIGCGICIKNCPQKVLTMTKEGIASNENLCRFCGTCSDNCPALAMEICGREWNMEDLIREIEKEHSVMQHGKGGVTISGGEPLMHPEFTLGLLGILGNLGIHRAVDTTLFANPEVVEKIAGNCELFLIDLKCMDNDIHKKFTGVSNELILRNIGMIASIRHPYYIRIPLISEVNATEENIASTIEFLSSLPERPEIVDLLLYHDIGKGKHERMGSVYNPDNLSLSAPGQDKVERFVSMFEKEGLNVRLGG